MVLCPLCAGCFSQYATMLKHIRLTHADEPSFSIQCNLQGCKRTFRNFRTYRNHIYTWHDTTDLDTQEDLSLNLEEDRSSDEHGQFGDEDLWIDYLDHSLPSRIDQPSSLTLARSTLQRASALWILKTRELHWIPYATMDTILADLQSLFGVAFDRIRHQMEQRIVAASTIVDVKQVIQEELSDSSSLVNIFTGLETQHQQLRYFRSNFKLVVSMPNCTGINNYF